jgi:hypothetical protein
MPFKSVFCCWVDDLSSQAHNENYLDCYDQRRDVGPSFVFLKKKRNMLVKENNL